MTSRSRAAALAAGVLLLLAAGWGVWRLSRAPDARPAPPREYVGSNSCVGCHAAEGDAWRGSQHAAAMAEATDRSVRAPFDGSSFDYGDVRSTFFRRDSAFFVRTDGPDGRLADFPIAFTFGVAPLQQYLIEMPGGRLQALGIAWDTRPAAEGGARWFHLYAGQNIRAGDPLHWTGVDQNWNYMCADCHSTNVRKGYDATTREFRTTYSEISVGCEACHGPGSAHVEWARSPDADAPAGLYLTAVLDERQGVAWGLDPSTATPVRSQPREEDREIQVCARCHARRSQLTDAFEAGDRFEDGFRASLLESPLFFPDGQQRDEVYTYASFLQSRMYASGVTCSDCHDPHTGAVRAAGNLLCTQCHVPAAYDAPSHSFHPADTPAAACTACHMPTRTYMTVDPRHDHSFRIPRPDRTVTLGTPNACTSACHADRDAAWAAVELRQRTGHEPGGFQRFAEAFDAADRAAPGTGGGLAEVAKDPAEPAIARASALARMAGGPWVDLDAATRGLRDPSPLVRRGAITALCQADDVTRLTLVAPLLDDEVRTVRTQAVPCLADMPDGRLPEAFTHAFDEFVAEQQFNGDRADAQVNLGTVLASRRRFDEALAALREAIRLDPTYVPAYVNLADVHRARGDETSAETVLRNALDLHPDAAELHHALGLTLVRRGRTADALPELAAAARLAPDVARYTYVQAVALHDTGRADAAVTVLARALAAHPADRDLLLALAEYTDEQGRRDDARGYAQRLLALDPNDPAAQALAARLR